MGNGYTDLLEETKKCTLSEGKEEGLPAPRNIDIPPGSHQESLDTIRVDALEKYSNAEPETEIYDEDDAERGTPGLYTDPALSKWGHMAVIRDYGKGVHGVEYLDCKNQVQFGIRGVTSEVANFLLKTLEKQFMRYHN